MSQEQQRAYLEALSSTFDVAERIRGSCSQIPPLEIRGLVSSLDRNSGTPRGVPALASSTDTSGTSDKRPVLIQHAGQGALFVDHECFTQAWTSCLEPGHQCEGTRRPARLSLPNQSA